MPTVKTENVLFDLDGTLIDSFPGIEYSTRVAFSAVIPQHEMPDLRRFIGPPIRDVLRRAVSDVGTETLDELERQFRVSYDSGGWQRAVVYDGVMEMLLQLSQATVKNFIVTNKPILPAKKILERLGLMRYFEGVISLNSKTPPFSSKAEAAAYLIAQHGLDIQSTLFVGDSVDDARAAQLCGLRFVGVTYGYGRPHFQQDYPVHIILNSMSKLISVIRSHDYSDLEMV